MYKNALRFFLYFYDLLEFLLEQTKNAIFY